MIVILKNIIEVKHIFSAKNSVNWDASMLKKDLKDWSELYQTKIMFREKNYRPCFKILKEYRE